MSKTDEDGTARLKIHSSGQIQVGLLPESVEDVGTSTFILHLNTINSHPRVIQLENGNCVNLRRDLI